MKSEIKSNLSDHSINDRISMRPWLPERELLHHPNIKLFITHGGTSSVNEGLYML